MDSLRTSGKNHLVLVVGYDGTEPAERALRLAAETLEDSSGPAPGSSSSLTCRPVWPLRHKPRLPSRKAWTTKSTNWQGEPTKYCAPPASSGISNAGTGKLRPSSWPPRRNSWTPLGRVPTSCWCLEVRPTRSIGISTRRRPECSAKTDSRFSSSPESTKSHANLGNVCGTQWC